MRRLSFTDFESPAPGLSAPIIYTPSGDAPAR
jgi:hypothetical protein